MRCSPGTVPEALGNATLRASQRCHTFVTFLSRACHYPSAKNTLFLLVGELERKSAETKCRSQMRPGAVRTHGVQLSSHELERRRLSFLPADLSETLLGSKSTWAAGQRKYSCVIDVQIEGVHGTSHNPTSAARGRKDAHNARKMWPHQGQTDNL